MDHSTKFTVSFIPRGVGRPRINNEQTMARFPAGTLDRIKAQLGPTQKQSDYIRAAVLAALDRDERRD